MSWLYRWLTAEPEADVVVIDLRETMFVGPVLAALDRVVGPGARHWRDSATGRAVTHLSERFVARPIRTTGVAVLVAAIASLLFLIGLGSPSRGGTGIAERPDRDTRLRSRRHAPGAAGGSRGPGSRFGHGRGAGSGLGLGPGRPPCEVNGDVDVRDGRRR
ncbi:hypothetical protein BRC78_09000 [Halobacteriales archaeon QH_8_68_33]|nr:MAG: hypothetical protein BRC78_09000 [Halobacteriales archaeon QH_8_68_33]